MCIPHNRQYTGLILMSLMFSLASCSKSTRNEGNPTTTTGVTSQEEEQKHVSVSIQPKLYFEHSGSMFGYDGPKVNGNFRHTIDNLLTTLTQSDTTQVFIVNDQVYPYPKSYTELIKSGNLFQSRIGKSDRTDFEKIFRTITDSLKENELAILTTDLIYSDKGTGVQIASRIAETAKELARNSLKSYAKDGSLLVWQLSSGFSGSYYSFDSPNSGHTYQGDRPVYLIFFARNATMDRLLTDETYARFRETTEERYPGYRNAVLFNNGLLIKEPFYTFHEYDPDAKSSFDEDREGDHNGKGAIHAIKNVKSQRSNGPQEPVKLSVAISMPMANDPAWLDTANYAVDGGFKLMSVKRVTDRSDQATHHFLLAATQPIGGRVRVVQIRAKRQFPPGWVTTSTTLNDTAPNPNTDFAKQTFGLEPLLTGVADAYDGYTNDRKYYFTCSLYLRN